MHPGLEQSIQEIGSTGNGENFYRDLFAEVPIACFSVGVDGCIRAANRQALGLTGYRLSDVLGQRVLDLYADTADGKVKAQEQFLEFRAGAEVRATELEMRRVDGTSVWINLLVRAIRDRVGRVAASCSVVEEITKQPSAASLSLFQPNRGEVFSLNDPERIASATLFGPTEGLLTRFPIKSGRTSYVIKMEDIDWVGAAGNYAELHIGKKSHLMRTTMNTLEAKLDPLRFLRIHRSVIINVERVKELRPWHYGDHKIVLLDGTQLTLKRCHSEQLERLLGGPI